jgi:hypothetical protein
MNPDNVMAQPACCGVLHRYALLVGQCRVIGLEDVPAAGLSRCRDAPTDRPHQHSGHHAGGRVERARRRNPGGLGGGATRALQGLGL